MGFGGDLEVEDGDFRVEPANVSWEEIFYHGFFGCSCCMCRFSCLYASDYNMEVKCLVLLLVQNWLCDMHDSNGHLLFVK